MDEIAQKSERERKRPKEPQHPDVWEMKQKQSRRKGRRSPEIREDTRV